MKTIHLLPKSRNLYRPFLLIAMLALTMGFIPLATVHAQSDSPGSKPLIGDNPDLAASCGIQLILVLDESGSIQNTAGAEGAVRNASGAFVNALADTGSEIAIVEFGSRAKTVFGYTPVTSGASGTIATTFDPYIFATATSGDIYDAPSQMGGWTNWDDALDEAESINASSDVAPLVVFVTDGDPTAYNRDYSGEDGGVTTGATGGAGAEQALWRAMEEANMVKAQGSHILVIGVGSGLDNAASQQRLRDVSGPDEFTGSPDVLNIQTDDVARVTNFADLETALRQIAFDLCAPSLTVTKLVDEGNGEGYVPGAGWEFTANVESPTPGGTDYAWVFPDDTSNPGDTVAGNTKVDGTLTFQWDPNSPTASKITVAETQQAGYNFEGVACQVRSLENPNPQPLDVTVVGASFEAELGQYTIVTCEVRNKANQAPDAVDDNATVNEDESVTIPVLGNDVDPDGDPLTVTEISDPANGTATINPDGTVTYTPDENFCGQDTFTYTISDGSGGTDTATVTVDVVCVSDPPVAQDDSYSTAEDTPITVPAPGVLDNDSDPENDPLTVTSHTQPANGTVTVNPDGSLSYTPNPNFNGIDTFEYTISDGNGGTDTATVTIDVTPVNDAPDAVDDNATVNEDEPVNIPVLGNDVDPDGDPLTVTEVSDPTNGTATINPDGTVTYTPDENFCGQDTFTYTISDGNGGTDTAAVTVNVICVNDPPVAQDDSGTTPEDTPITIDAAANDTDVDGNLDPASATVISGPANGTVANNGDGTFTYTPNPNFNGQDSFDYQICDTNGACDTATVTIDVTPVNDAPDAVDDNATVNEDEPVTIPVLGNDTDPDGDPLIVADVSDPANGTATINPDGTVTYTPDVDFCGQDTFTYTVEDPSGASDMATVTVDVICVNDPPVAQDDTASTDEDVPVTIPVLDNDSDPDDDPLTVTQVSDPTNGSVTINPDGTVTYTPDPNFNGTDTFTYEACDPSGACDTATVTVVIGALNDPPVAQDDSATTPEDTPVQIDVALNDTDVDGNLDPSTTTVLDGPGHGTLVNNGDGTFNYIPDPNYNGPDSFTYEICDTDGLCDMATVNITVTPVNDVPVAADDSYNATEDTPLTVPAPGVLTNDTDPDGDALTVESYTQSANGTLVQNPDGSFTYTPNPNFCGPDSYTYTVSDGNGGTDTATVFIDVACVNDAPVAADDAYSTDEDVVLTVPAPGVLVNDTDPDGDALVVDSFTQPANGTLVQNPDGSFTYTPDANFNGVDSYTYTVSDGNGGTDTATVTITVNPVNDPPLAADDSYNATEDTPLFIAAPGVLTNDTDPDGDALTVESYTQPVNGTLVQNPDGSFTYTPNPNFCGPDSYTYTVSDGNGSTDTATVFIDVACVNDAPVAADDAYSTDEDVVLTVPAPGVLVNDIDPDGDALVVDSFTQPANGTLVQNPDGSFVYTPDANFNGVDSYTYTVSDGNGGTDTATVTITVNPVNDPLVAVDDNYTTQQDTTLTVDASGILVNDSDLDGDAIFVDSFDATSQFGGSVSANADGSFSYTPVPGFAGVDTFTYTISDGNGGFDTATVAITVEAKNNRSISVHFQEWTYDGTFSGLVNIQNQSGPYPVQIDDLAIELEYKAPGGGGWTYTAVVDGSCSFDPTPPFVIGAEGEQMYSFSGCQTIEPIPAGATVRVTAKVHIFGRIKGGGKADGWFLDRLSKELP